MPISADLTALRALVETVLLWPHAAACEAPIGHPCTCPRADVPAAQAALERVEDRLLALHVDPTGHLHRCARVNGQWLCAPDCPGKAAQARLTRLEEALRKFGVHLGDCPRIRAATEDQLGTCDCGLDAALEGRDE